MFAFRPGALSLKNAIDANTANALTWLDFSMIMVKFAMSAMDVKYWYQC